MNIIDSTLILIIFVIGMIGCKMDDKNITIDLNELTVAHVHMAYSNGDYNCQQLTSAYLERIEHFDAPINAITAINSEALIIAKDLDDEFKRTGVLRPLHGIPLLVKDNINTAGLPTSAGALALKDYIPDEDAFIIKKLKKAGAIVIAKTNMAEWAFSPMHTESSTAGTTRNPYNLEYVPAGSSGGTGAAMASNFAIIGLGTDTGNSIRGPSSHCSLVGFRSTLGLVSRSAIVPLYLRNDVVGPMCRTVEDAAKVLQVIAGIDPSDPITRYAEGKIPQSYEQFLLKDGLQGARIGVLRAIRDTDPDPEIKALFDQALVDMTALGAVFIDPISIPDYANLRQNQWCADFRKDIASFLATYVKRDSLLTIEDIIRIGTKSKYTEDRLERNASNSGRWENPEIQCDDAYNDIRRIAFRHAIRSTMDSLQLDAIVYPSWNNRPAKIDSFSEEYQGDNNQIISPHTGQPAFTVPMGYISGDLPLGLQFLGRMFDEPTIIKLAYSYEQGSMHRKPPVLRKE